jgi:hypothetical protein
MTPIRAISMGGVARLQVPAACREDRGQSDPVGRAFESLAPHGPTIHQPGRGSV